MTTPSITRIGMASCTVNLLSTRAALRAALTLAVRAKMRAALAYDDAPNGSAATAARLTRPPIRAKMILVIAFGIDPVNRRPFVPEAVRQRGADAAMQRRHFVRRECSRASQGMKPGSPQRFVGVNVADPSDKGLIEQQRLERTGLPPDHFPKCLERKGGLEWLRAKPACDLRRITRQVDTPELARIIKAQLVAIIERKAKVNVLIARHSLSQHI
jgi:hypothetical protein